MERVKFVEPVVGMGATMGVGSHRYPYTIVEVNKTGKTIVLQADNYELVEGDAYGSEHQVYRFFPNPDAEKIVARLRKDGSYGQGLNFRFHIGHRSAYRDPHF
jgi:hypothetical protein